MLSEKRKSVLIKIFVVLGLCAIGMSLTKLLCIGDAKTPVLKEIKGIELISITADSANISAHIVLENPNNFAITIQKLQADILFENNKIGKLSIVDSCVLPANGSAQMKIKSEMQTDKVVEAFSRGKDSLLLTLQGNASVKAFGMMFNKDVAMPFTFSLNSSIYKLLKEQTNSKKMIVTDKASLESISLDNSIVNISFHIANSYPLPFEILSYPSKIYINDKFVGEGNITNPIAVKNSDSSAVGEMKFSLNNFDLASTALSGLLQLKAEWKYRTEGDLRVKIFGRELKMPFTGNGTLVKL